MADQEKKPINKKGGEAGAAEEDEEEDEGCCTKFCAIIATICSAIYRVTVIICRGIRDCLAFIWYPCKERCCNCVDDCDKKMNPWKDPSYTHV